MQILVQYPDCFRTYEARKEHHYNEGHRYFFKDYRKDKQYAFISPKYKPFLFNGHPTIFQLSGNLSGATPNDDVLPHLRPTDPDCPGDDLSILIATDINAQSYRAMHKSYTTLFIIVGCILLIGLSVWLITKNSNPQPQTIESPTIESSYYAPQMPLHYEVNYGN